MSIKLMSFWIIGAALMLGGNWILQNLEMVVGVSEISYVIAMLIAFVLFLIAGLCWVSVAVATRKRFL